MGLNSQIRRNGRKVRIPSNKSVPLLLRNSGSCYGCTMIYTNDLFELGTVLGKEGNGISTRIINADKACIDFRTVRKNDPKVVIFIDVSICNTNSLLALCAIGALEGFKPFFLGARIFGMVFLVNFKNTNFIVLRMQKSTPYC